MVAGSGDATYTTTSIAAEIPPVATFEVATGLNQVNRENGKRRVVVTANVRGRDLGSFVAEVQAAVRENVSVPAGYWVEYGGTFQQLESATQRLALVVPLTSFVIAGLLFFALHSARDAAVIFSGVPLALTGGVLVLWIRDIPLVDLGGRGIHRVVRHRRAERPRHGHLRSAAPCRGRITARCDRRRRADALAHGAHDRTGRGARVRTMAFNTGIGSEVQRPLATVVIGGIISSTLLTLVVLPALYELFGAKSVAERKNPVATA